MDGRMKLIWGAATICLSVLAVAVFTLFPANQGSGEPSGTNENVDLRGYVVIDVYRPSGGDTELIYHHESHNVITDVGLHVIARELNGQGRWQWTVAEGGNDLFYDVGDPRYIALSCDDTGVDAAHASWQAVDGSYASDIEIITGGLERVRGNFTSDVAYTAGTGGTTGSLTYSVSETFTVQTGSSFTAVQKAGLFMGNYTTTDGLTSNDRISPLIAENIFPPVDLIAGDQIAVTWRITL